MTLLLGFLLAFAKSVGEFDDDIELLVRDDLLSSIIIREAVSSRFIWLLL